LLARAASGEGLHGTLASPYRGGETEAQILAAHPRLTAENIHAALAFAASTLREHFAA
jgi:uncharacterized protein (DUF433 family)